MSELPPGGVPGVSAYLPAMIDQGMSARAALGAFREAGGRIGNETFRSLYAEARDALANRDAIAALDMGALPPDEVLSSWAAGEPDQFATFVQSFVRMPGEREIESRFYTFVTDTPHTPQEAIDAAAGFYTDDAVGTSGTPQGIYQGSVVTSMTRTVTR